MVLGVGVIGRVVVGNRLLQVSTMLQYPSHDVEHLLNSDISNIPQLDDVTE